MSHNVSSAAQAALQDTIAQYDPIIGIISPPRCSATAFARVFWQHPAIRYYAHEPFEVTYYLNEDVTTVAQQLNQPLDLAALEEARQSRRRTQPFVPARTDQQHHLP